MTELQSYLRRHKLLALDTSVFIYALEAHPRYGELARNILAWIGRPGHAGVTSTITMTEALVKPYIAWGVDQVDDMYELLATSPNLEWIAPAMGIAKRAAELRALHRLKTPDALQAATALESGATGFVTNDAIFTRIPGFETLLFDSLV